jgi:hypothetical protein
MVSVVRRKSDIFISYRRGEAAGIAGRLSDRLSERFGEDHVFMDIASIVPGADFSEKIISKVSKCGVMLVLIGPQWVGTALISRRRRIDKPDDWVRVEIETALQQGIWIIPVLVDGAEMPKTGDLPQSLRPLTRRHAFKLSNEGFRSEVGHLIEAIEEGYRVPQEEWRLSLQSRRGSTSAFRLSSGSREHLIAISLTNRGMSAIDIDGESVETGFTSAGITGREIPVAALSRQFGPVATIRVDILNPATTYVKNTPACFRVTLLIDDQLLEYETEEYDRSVERRSRNQLRRQRASDSVGRASGAVADYLNSDDFKHAFSNAVVNSYRDLSKNEALKGAIKDALRDALKRAKR